MESRKAIKKKQFEFNPADYDYMDSMPLEGWIWEIIRRSEEYTKDYKELEIILTNSERDAFSISEFFAVAEKRSIDLVAFSLEFGANGLPREFIRVPDPDYFLVTGDLSIPKPQSKYIDVKDSLEVGAIEPVTFYPYKKYIDREIHSLHKVLGEFDGTLISQEDDVAAAEHLFVRHLAISTPEDTIYVGISRKARIKDIEKCLLKKIRGYLTPKKKRERDDRWKYYLIVYDLKEENPNLNYEDVSNILIDAYPDVKTKTGKKTQLVEGGDFFDTKKCENFYKSALALINGDYKKYLYL